MDQVRGQGFNLTRYSSLNEVRAAWTALQENAQTHPFQSLHWHDAWASAVSLKPE
jgi:CelD/BcsL family acetyltransferase involved in cellulose biosynthesis